MGSTGSKRRARGAIGVGSVSAEQPDIDAATRTQLAFLRAEFLGPVAGLAGMIDILSEDADAAGLERYASDLGRMRDAAAALHGLVDALLGPAEDATERPTGRSLRHDLTTSVSAVLGYGELVAEEAREHGDAVLFGPLADVLDAAGNLLRAIDKLAAVSDTVASAGDLTSVVAPEALPEILRVAAEVARGLSEHVAPASDVLKGRILVVDDTASMRELVARRLERDGHDVAVAESGPVAIRMARSERFDLLLLDLMMPGMNGLEVLDRLRGLPETRTLPVIVISALDNVDTAVRCIAAGADDFLAKPLNEVLLRARIGSSLERKFLRDREQDALHRLRREQERSDALLNNVLPADAVERLRRGETVIADQYDELTVLFCDVVGFTPLATKLPPADLVDLLNGVFSGFDRLAEEYGLEKIKTIGDAYLLVGGRLDPGSDHALRVVTAACRMPAVAASVDAAHPLSVRIGVDTGPAVGGIIGRRKFFYDIWGDTVNFASRLEGSATPGRVHVSAAVHGRTAGAIAYEARPEMEIKGKHVVQTYHVAVDGQP